MQNYLNSLFGDYDVLNLVILFNVVLWIRNCFIWHDTASKYSGKTSCGVFGWSRCASIIVTKSSRFLTARLKILKFCSILQLSGLRIYLNDCSDDMSPQLKNHEDWTKLLPYYSVQKKIFISNALRNIQLYKVSEDASVCIKSRMDTLLQIHVSHRLEVWRYADLIFLLKSLYGDASNV